MTTVPRRDGSDGRGLRSRSSRIAAAAVLFATVLLTLTVPSPGSAPASWPPFLGARDGYPPHIADAVERLWVDATITRTVIADAGPVPLRFFLRFVDAPDVAAAAARHLHLTTYDVKMHGDDSYEANGGGARGVYRVLVRDGGQRVVLSWGTHRGSILGTIGGSALTQLEFGAADGRLTQRLVVNAIIDDGMVASIARPVIRLFGRFVDRKLTEAFQTTAAAAAWASANPDEFCAWLDRMFTGRRRTEVLDAFDGCDRT